MKTVKTTDQSRIEIADKLRDIQEEILDLLKKSKKLLYNAPDFTRQRADYWLQQTAQAITKDDDSFGQCMVSMSDTISELENDDVDEYDEDDES